MSKEFKVGDKVLHIPHSYSNNPLAFSTVCKVIKKHKNGNVVTDCSPQQFRQTGNATGKSWVAPHLEHATVGFLQERRNQIAIVKAERVKK